MSENDDNKSEGINAANTVIGGYFAATESLLENNNNAKLALRATGGTVGVIFGTFSNIANGVSPANSFFGAAASVVTSIGVAAAVTAGFALALPAVPAVVVGVAAFALASIVGNVAGQRTVDILEGVNLSDPSDIAEDVVSLNEVIQDAAEAIGNDVDSGEKTVEEAINDVLDAVQEDFIDGLEDDKKDGYQDALDDLRNEIPSPGNLDPNDFKGDLASLFPLPEDFGDPPGPTDPNGNPLPPPPKPKPPESPGESEEAGDEGGQQQYGSPLVLDLDGDGIELISLDNTQAYFDLDANGFATRTGWVNRDDGLLAIDRNGDGIINNGSELFGNTNGFAHGFESLMTYDSNLDGVIDNQDAAFDDLLIWRDFDQDGETDAGELSSLTEPVAGRISFIEDVPDVFGPLASANVVAGYATRLSDRGF
jgi:hypothetical protein